MKEHYAEAASEWGIDPKAEMYKLPAMHAGLMQNGMQNYIRAMART